jgi:hypothetical protein
MFKPYSHRSSGLFLKFMGDYISALHAAFEYRIVALNRVRADIVAHVFLTGVVDAVMAEELAAEWGALNMDLATTGVTVNLSSDTFEAIMSEGFRLCLEGFVPLRALPAPNPQSRPDRRQACLETVRAALPQLIPEPWRARIRL